MAKSKPHKANGQYTNPEVRFERHDIETGEVLTFAIVLSVVIAVATALAIFVAVFLTRSENRSKETNLPVAKVDEDALPPQPRLEALEDLREQKPDPKNKQKTADLFPPRAKMYLADQEQQLRKRDRDRGIEPISEAIDQLAGRLPARKQPPPSTYGVTLPSKAASGRVETGGQ